MGTMATGAEGRIGGQQKPLAVFVTSDDERILALCLSKLTLTPSRRNANS